VQKQNLLEKFSENIFSVLKWSLEIRFLGIDLSLPGINNLP